MIAGILWLVQIIMDWDMQRCCSKEVEGQACYLCPSSLSSAMCFQPILWDTFKQFTIFNC